MKIPNIEDYERIDYNDINNWLNLPENPQKSVDVFYVYPTAYFRTKNSAIVADINHSGMRRGAETVYAVQASAFIKLGNVYAPFYRQLDISVLMKATMQERNGFIGSVPKMDVTDAFSYYINNYNNDRPFILLSHSQGSSVTKELMFDYMKAHTDVLNRMIAAYIIGYGVTEEELKSNPHLKFAKRADDTGVIISYNTETTGCVGENLTVPEGSLVINPLNWKTDETYAPPELNRGSLVTGRGRLEIKKGFADAQIDLKRGTLICASVPAEEYGSPPPLGTFHSSDISFYYLNLRDNAELRIKKYFEKI